MNRKSLTLIAIGLAAASVALSVLFKGVFLVLLVPAFFFWSSARSKDGR